MIKGGLSSCLDMVVAVAVTGWLWWRLWFWRRVRFNYSIVYLVNYHWCSYLELKNPFEKGFFKLAMELFSCSVVYLINYDGDKPIVLYLGSLDLPSKTWLRVQLNTPFLNPSQRLSNPFNHFYIS